MQLLPDGSLQLLAIAEPSGSPHGAGTPLRCEVQVGLGHNWGMHCEAQSWLQRLQGHALTRACRLHASNRTVLLRGWSSGSQVLLLC